MKSNSPILFLAWLCLAAAGFSAPQTEEELKKVVDSLNWRDGNILLNGDVATLKVSRGFKFLDGADASKVLSQIWGNPPSSYLGMIFPEGMNPAADNSWGAVVERFADEGYVKDDDADKQLDSAKLLKELQDGQNEANVRRKEQGYPELEIVGWAIEPRYDKETKKILWGIDLKRVGGTQHSLNYYVRVLGRRGHLVINAIGGLNQVKEIEAAMPQVLSMVEFNEGHRYADFDAKKGDKVATYGIAGLILGAVGLKVAAKLGILALFAKKFGVILLFLKKGVIVVIAAFAALFGKIKSFFTGRKSNQDSAAGPSA